MINIQNCKVFNEQFRKSNKYLLTYLRKGTQAVGVMLAAKTDDGVVRVTYSKCKLRAKGVRLDVFNKDFGTYVAIQRLLKKRVNENPPHVVQQHLPEFVDRAKRYFKTENVVAPKV